VDDEWLRIGSANLSNRSMASTPSATWWSRRGRRRRGGDPRPPHRLLPNIGRVLRTSRTSAARRRHRRGDRGLASEGRTLRTSSSRSCRRRWRRGRGGRDPERPFSLDALLTSSAPSWSRRAGSSG
jgi:hypothetical protein